jgi:hypothetical protein
MPIDPQEDPPIKPGQPSEPPQESPPGNPRPEVPPPLQDPGEPPRPHELPGRRCRRDLKGRSQGRAADFADLEHAVSDAMPCRLTCRRDNAMRRWK